MIFRTQHPDGNGLGLRQRFHRTQHGVPALAGSVSTPSRAQTDFAFRISSAFTLIELILVMTILAIAVSFTAPALANFFRGRSLDYEARRLLALTRQGQSRAISEGLPMELWFDSSKSAYGLEAEPSYEAVDSKAISFAFDSQLQIEFANQSSGAHFGSLGLASSSGSGNSTPSSHPNLPKIRFLPDGSISEGSPQSIHVIGRDGASLWLMLSRNRLNYEIRTQNN
jgi:prepilin-type N-terminal cleavage/methylation domain-containing protein